MIKEPVYYYAQQDYNFSQHNTGIQRVVRQLAKGLLNIGIDLVPVEWDSSNGRLVVIKKNNLDAFSRYDGPSVDSWKYDGEYFPIKDAKHLIFPDISNPRGTTEKRIIDFAKSHGISVYTVFHDAIPAVFPQWYVESEDHISYMNNICESEMVFTVSESAKRDLMKFTPKTGHNKIHALHLPNQIKDKRPAMKDNDTKSIEVLCVSTVEIRKNHKRMLEAFKIARGMLLSDGYRMNITLVGTVQRWNEPVEAVKHAVIYDSATWYMDVSDRDLKNMYLNADFTIYPSEYEGYGLPIVESLSMNTPVLCSNTSSMPEIASSGGCVMFDPYNVQDMANKIYAMAINASLRRKLVKEINKVPKTTWDDYAKKMISYIEGK